MTRFNALSDFDRQSRIKQLVSDYADSPIDLKSRLESVRRDYDRLDREFQQALASYEALREQRKSMEAQLSIFQTAYSQIAEVKRQRPDPTESTSELLSRLSPQKIEQLKKLLGLTESV